MAIAKFNLHTMQQLGQVIDELNQAREIIVGLHAHIEAQKNELDLEKLRHYAAQVALGEAERKIKGLQASFDDRVADLRLALDAECVRSADLRRALAKATILSR